MNCLHLIFTGCGRRSCGHPGCEHLGCESRESDGESASPCAPNAAPALAARAWSAASAW